MLGSIDLWSPKHLFIDALARLSYYCIFDSEKLLTIFILNKINVLLGEDKTQVPYNLVYSLNKTLIQTLMIRQATL